LISPSGQICLHRRAFGPVARGDPAADAWRAGQPERRASAGKLGAHAWLADLTRLTYVFQDFPAFAAVASVRGMWRTLAAMRDHGLDAAARARVPLDDCCLARHQARPNSADAHCPNSFLWRDRNSGWPLHAPWRVTPCGDVDGRTLQRAGQPRRANCLMRRLSSACLWAHASFTAVYVTHNSGRGRASGHKIVVLSRRPGQIR